MSPLPLALSLVVLLSATGFHGAFALDESKKEEIKVPGTRVFLSPPSGFLPAERFGGFLKKDESASIAVTEIPGPYDQVNIFNKTDLLGKGITVTSKTVLNSGKREASLIEFTQDYAGQKFKKVTFVFGDSVSTVLVTGTMPENGSSTLFESMREAVKTARYDARAKLADLEEGLPFSIADTKVFKKATRLQNTLLFTTTGKLHAGRDNGPLFVAGQSSSEGHIENREDFARDRLLHTRQLKNILVDTQKSFKQAGLDGEQFTGSGADTEDGAPTFIFHALVFDAGGYFIFQGLCPLSERKTYEPEYEKLVRNFELRRPAGDK